MLNLVLILGPGGAVCFGESRAESRGMLCVGHRDAVLRKHAHTLTALCTHAHIQDDTQIAEAGPKVGAPIDSSGTTFIPTSFRI